MVLIRAPKELRDKKVKRKPAAGNFASEKEEDFLLNIEANLPSPKAEKHLHTQDALADEMGVMTTADTVTPIIFSAKDNEKCQSLLVTWKEITRST